MRASPSRVRRKVVVLKDDFGRTDIFLPNPRTRGLLLVMTPAEESGETLLYFPIAVKTLPEGPRQYRNSQAAGRRRPQPIERPRFNGRTDIWISFLPAWISFRSIWISFRLAWNSFRPAWNPFRPAWNRFLAA
jgi:hypothetical protein